jgi:predicted ATPase with chaperone activity
VYILARAGFMGIRKSPVPARMLLSTNIRNAFQDHFWTVLIRRIRIEVPRVDYEKLSRDRVGEASDSIRTRVQAARDKQGKRFSKNGSSDIVCDADLRVGEIRQLCKLPDEGQNLPVDINLKMYRL